MAFGVLISNTDDHLRNHGFLLESHAGWVLSPAFDLNPDPGPGAKQLALAIDYDDPSARVELLFEVVDAFGLRPTDAARVLGEVEEAVSGWRRCATRAGVGPGEIELMAPAFEHAEREAAGRFLGASS
jgi:serine/threonine-protein kinase HipA